IPPNPKDGTTWRIRIKTARRVKSSLTKPVDEKIPANESAPQMQKRQMNVSEAFIANSQPTILIEPGPRAFHYPAIPTQAFRRLDSAAGNPRRDPAPAQLAAQGGGVIRFIGRQLHWPFAGAAQGTFDRGQRIEGGAGTSIGIVRITECSRVHFS